MKYKYESPIGTMIIKQIPNGRWELFYDGDSYDSCISPQDVADDFLEQQTGCTEWDLIELPITSVPLSLDEWTKLS